MKVFGSEEQRSQKPAARVAGRRGYMEGEVRKEAEGAVSGAWRSLARPTQCWMGREEASSGSQSW